MDAVCQAMALDLLPALGLILGVAALADLAAILGAALIIRWRRTHP